MSTLEHHRVRLLKLLPVSSIHAKPAVLVARTAHRPFRIGPVFNLNGLALRGSSVRGERHRHIADSSTTNYSFGLKDNQVYNRGYLGFL